MEYLKSIIFKIHALAKGLFFGLMVTTAWMAYRVCESALGGSTTLPQIWESLLIVGAALVVTYLIDNALYQSAVASLAQAIKQGGLWKIRKEGGITTLVLLALLLGRFFFSGGATYLTGESTVTERQVSNDNLALVEKLNKKKDAAISSIKSAKQKEADRILADAKAQAAEIKQSAEYLAKKRVETAIAQGSSTEQEAYRNKEWVRASYSNAIKKAKQDAYLIEEQAAKKAEALLADAQASHKAILSTMQEEVYRERNSAKWQQLGDEVDRKINAQLMLWTAERWTYYLLDFILVVGGFFCSWLVAVYIVKTDATIETFFPDKPGLSDVIFDMIASIYTYIVTTVAQAPAYFKSEASKKMLRVSKSVGRSSSAYNAAIAEYIVANHPAVNAQFGAAAHHNAMLEAKLRAKKKMKAPTPEEEDEEVYSETLRNNAIELDLEVSSGEGATAQQSAETPMKPAAKQVQRSGSLFRAYLSRAGKYAEMGNVAAAGECIEKARQALPDDHLAASRISKIESLKKMINA